MAENVLDSGPPSAKRPKLSSPALSASASDGNGKYYKFFSFFTRPIYLMHVFLSVVYMHVHTQVLKGHVDFYFLFCHRLAWEASVVGYARELALACHSSSR